MSDNTIYQVLFSSKDKSKRIKCRLLQFLFGDLRVNTRKSVQKLFHNLHISFSNLLMGFKVICQLEIEPLRGLANVQEIFS